MSDGAASALSDVTGAGQAAVTLRERPRIGMLRLRGQPDEPAFVQAAQKVLGLTLPMTPNTAVTQGEVTALWLAPDEWLVLSPPDAQQALEKSLNEAFGDLFAGVTDVSSGYVALEVSGPQTDELLARGCPVDLHPREFGPGRCAQTLLEKADVTLLRLTGDGERAFLVVVRRSFADYLWRWLCAVVGDVSG